MGRIGKMGLMGMMGRMVETVGWVILTVKGTRNDDHTSSRKGKIGLIGKIGLMGVILNGVYADSLQQNCLQCHQAQKIPSGLIYRRYLMRYSTPKRIEKVMLAYLQKPERSRSIMPPQFFLKFPMKPEMQMNTTAMMRNIRTYIEYFDLKKRLVLEKEKR